MECEFPGLLYCVSFLLLVFLSSLIAGFNVDLQSPLTCNYFKWVDEEEMMEDAVYMNFVGQQLEEAMKKNEKLKKKLAGSRQKASCWFFVAVGSWAMTLFMCIKCGQKSMGTGCIEVGN